MGNRWIAAGVLGLLLGAVVALQLARERLAPLPQPVAAAAIVHLRTPQMARRIALTFDSLAADVYWIRALQHYGATRRAASAGRSYDQLYPLLDLTTSLDPYFRSAYRFGAIFLSEPYPGGAGRTDLAITLLEKGLRAEPARWEYAQDIGFVHYWWRRDYRAAADWFLRASDIPGAPDWMKPVAAVTLAEGGNRSSSRRLWQEVLAGADEDWLRSAATHRLRQLDELDRIDALLAVVARYAAAAGRPPASWADLVRSGYLQRVPTDADGFEYVFDPARGSIGLDPRSPLNPLPIEMVSPIGSQAPA